jgi:hypothetical protein
MNVWEHEGDWYYEGPNGLAVCCNSRRVAEHLASDPTKPLVEALKAARIITLHEIPRGCYRAGPLSRIRPKERKLIICPACLTLKMIDAALAPYREEVADARKV